VVTDVAGAEGLRPAWTDLLTRVARDEIALSPDWLLDWWGVYGNLQGRELRLGLFYDAGRLVGLAPLLRRRYWYRGCLPFRRLEFLASGERPHEGIYSNHLGVLAERGAEGEVARRLAVAIAAGAFGGWDEVVLPMMSGDGPMPGLLATAFRGAGLAAEMEVTARAPYISLPATWDDYLRSLTPNGRRSIVRSQKALDAWADGTTRLHAITDAVDLDRGKEILVQLHHARWHSDGVSGVFRSPSYLRFHEAMMGRLAGLGALELLWLSVRGEPVAALYAMAWAGKVYAYQTGRRTDLPGHLRPGAVLLALAIRRAIERGRHEFDLLADEAAYKLQFASQTRPLVRVRAARVCLVERARRLGFTCTGRLQSLRSSLFPSTNG
jgi:CelD/BcsL family acetyltransferase involved in cellulose biosynthesis